MNFEALTKLFNIMKQSVYRQDGSLIQSDQILRRRLVVRENWGGSIPTMHGNRVLVIDDDSGLLDLIELGFSRAGYQVYRATDGAKALRQFYAHQPQLVILDLMMPNIDGWEVCHQIRQLSDVPLIILSALCHKEQIVRGLNSGADDYITKPFDFDILLARARAALRRAELPAEIEKPVTYRDDYLTIDLDKHQIRVRGEPVNLTSKEYRLLAYLVQNNNQVLTYQQILEHVWGWNYRDSIDYVHVYISRLRQKLEVDPKCPKYLLTEHGLGYRFEK